VYVTEEKERAANYRAVYVTEICDTLHFYSQDVETGMFTTGVCVCTCKNAWRTQIPFYICQMTDFDPEYMSSKWVLVKLEIAG